MNFSDTLPFLSMVLKIADSQVEQKSGYALAPSGVFNNVIPHFAQKSRSNGLLIRGT